MVAGELWNTVRICLKQSEDDEDVSRIDRESGSAEAAPRHSIENKTLVVTTIKSPPYAMFKQSPER